MKLKLPLISLAAAAGAATACVPAGAIAVATPISADVVDTSPADAAPATLAPTLRGPAAWTLLLCGFAMVGYSLRRPRTPPLESDQPGKR